MSYLRRTWPETRITPKLHMLEDHVIPFFSSWHVGCGFLGEQGVESIHYIINSVKSRYKFSIKKSTERLAYIMKEYLASTNPDARCIRKSNAKKPRALKRKAT